MKIKPNENPTSCSILEEKLMLDACLIKSYDRRSCFAGDNMYQSQQTCSQQKDLGRRYRHHTVPTWKIGACLHAYCSPSHLCFVQSLHTLIICINGLQAPSAHGHSVPSSGDGMFSLLCQTPYTKLNSRYADGYQEFNQINTTRVII